VIVGELILYGRQTANSSSSSFPGEGQWRRFVCVSAKCERRRQSKLAPSPKLANDPFFSVAASFLPHLHITPDH
jgi:hypothetical protein